jgi:hypothetical protein
MATEISEPPARPDAPPSPAMSPRTRRRVIAGLFALIALFFVAGVLAYVLDFRHHTVCPGGKAWVSRTDNGFGTVTYLCPNGQTVTQGLLPG